MNKDRHSFHRLHCFKGFHRALAGFDCVKSCLNSELLCFALCRVDNLAIIAVHLLKDASHLSSEEEEGESLSQRVFVALTPSEQQLNFLRNEYSTVSLG